MRGLKVLLIALICFISKNGFSQQQELSILLNGHKINYTNNWHLVANGTQKLTSILSYEQNMAPCIIIANTILQKPQLEEMQEMGFYFSSFLGKNHYLFIHHKNKIKIQPNLFHNYIFAIINYEAKYKISEDLYSNFEQYKNFTLEFCAANETEIKDCDLVKKFPNVFKFNSFTNVLSATVSSISELLTYANSPFIGFVGLGNDNNPQPLNFITGSVTKSSALHQVANGGLYGEDITVGVGDGGYAGSHLDFQNRIARISPYGPLWGQHSTHINGTIGGAGLLIEYGTGNAPKANILSDFFNFPILNSANYYKNYGMVITNNSYTMTNTNSCSYFGKYDSDCRFVDKTIKKTPQVLHVIAAGNSGSAGFNCTGTMNYGTISDGYQNAKNTLTIGGVYENLTLAASSGKGPTQDGRLKPELVAKGTWVYSTQYTNAYNYMGAEGTSFAAANATGGITLLYEKYKKTYGSYPSSALIKATALNTATDIENPGPDYKSGYGLLNIKKAADIIDANQYYTGTVANGASQFFTLNIPAGIAKSKILIYWHDTTSNVSGSKELINNLDMVITSPSSTNYFPYVLNPTSPATNASNGIENLNNHEQIEINNPSAGAYTITVNGTSVPMGPQEFIITYINEPKGIQLYSPFGEEKFRPSDAVYFYFETFGLTTGTVDLQYSTNNGSTWTTIVSGLSNSTKQYAWNIPATAATNSQYLFRVQNTTEAVSDQTATRTVVMKFPTIIAATSSNNEVKGTWNSIAGVDAYEVLVLRNNEWERLTLTTDTFFVWPNLNTGTTEYFTVRGIKDGMAGRRANAASVVVSAATSTVSNDIAVSKLIYPKFGRNGTSSQLGNTEYCQIQIKNNSNTASGSIQVLGYLNGTLMISETVTGSIAANSSIDYTCTTPINLSAFGTHKLLFVVNQTGDPIVANDSLEAIVPNYINSALSLPYTQDFEAAIDTGAFKTLNGITGATEVDFSSSLVTGRIKTKDGNDLTNGKRGIIIDATDSTTSATNDIRFTYNLSSYTATDNILLNLKWKKNGGINTTTDSVFIRGNDAATWIFVTTLVGSSNGAFNSISNVKLSQLLSINSQAPSSSTQIKIKYATNYSTDIRNYGGGLILDDIELFNSPIDLQLTQIVSPINKCGTTIDSFKIKFISNSSVGIDTQYLYYSINGGAPVLEKRSLLLSPNVLTNYTFKTVPSLNYNQLYTIKFWAGNILDQNHTNDTLTVSVRLLPKITNLPHLETFENATQTFYTEGTNSSWELGTPNSELNQGAASGAKAWATGLNDDYNPNETSYLYSSCYDFTSSNQNIKISYHDIFETELGYDYIQLQYTTDNGTTWKTLGKTGNVYNGYTQGAPDYYFDGTQGTWRVHGFTLHKDSWGSNKTVQFRFKFFSDQLLTFDGIALDNWHVFADSQTVYNNGTRQNNIVGTGSSSFTHYIEDAHKVLSILDNAAALGLTEVGVYQNTEALRMYDDQYTMDRNWWVINANNTPANYTLRLFFTEAEVDKLNLLDTNMTDFRDIGVTRYSGSLEDSIYLNYDHYCNSCFEYFDRNSVSIVPYFDGMYVELQPQDFGEFWINTGLHTHSVALPQYFINTRAVRNSNGEATIRWNFAQSCPAGHFEVYKCDHLSSACSQFVQQTDGSCTTDQYQVIDANPPKTEGYYRIRWVQPSGFIEQSELVFLPASNFSNKLVISPNPSQGQIRVISPISAGDIAIQIMDISGKMVYSQNQNLQLGHTLHIATTLPSGVYILNISNGTQQYNSKFVVQQ